MIRSVPPTLLESTMTNIYITGGEGLIGQDCTIKAKDLPEKLPKGSRIQARIAALAGLSLWVLRPFVLPKE